MKKTKVIRMMLITALMVLGLLSAGCGREASAEESILWDAKPSVMINGVLYGDTGRSAPYRTDERPDRGGRVDGEITSSVESHKYPSENDQSNFGTGYFYRYGEDNTVELFFDGADKWKIFEAYEER